MKKNLVKKIALIMVVMIMVSLVSTVNYATSDSDLNEILHDIRDVPDNTVQPTQSAELPTTQNTAKTNTVLPKTGVDDTAMWVLIAVSAVAAIYTYKKVRDYNA